MCNDDLDGLTMKSLRTFLAALVCCTTSVLAQPSEEDVPISPTPSESSAEGSIPAGQYSLPNTGSDAYQRLEALQEAYDPQSQQWLQPYLEELAKAADNPTILEVGPGLGSMSFYMLYVWDIEGRLAGTSIEVLDNDPTFLGNIQNSPESYNRIKIVEADITTYELEERKYDLIYMRLVMMHLTKADHQNLIRKLEKALKPNGLLYIEDFIGREHKWRFETLDKIEPGFSDYMEAAYQKIGQHMDFTLAEKLPDMMSASGLKVVDMAATGTTKVSGGSPQGVNMRLAMKQLEPILKTMPEHDKYFLKALNVWDNAGIQWVDHTQIRIVGRKPSTDEITTEKNEDEL